MSCRRLRELSVANVGKAHPRPSRRIRRIHKCWISGASKLDDRIDSRSHGAHVKAQRQACISSSNRKMSRCSGEYGRKELQNQEDTVSADRKCGRGEGVDAGQTLPMRRHIFATAHRRRAIKFSGVYPQTPFESDRPAIGQLLPSPTFSTARKASCGISTRPIRFMRFLPSFCFSSSLRLRLMSPP